MPAFGVDVVFDSAALAEVLQGRQGPVARDIARRCVQVETRAKVYASGHGGGPRVRTGRLRGSITSEIRSEGGGLVGYVGSNVEYASFVELGTSRMRARPYLRPALSVLR